MASCRLCSGYGWLCMCHDEPVAYCRNDTGPEDTRPCEDCDGSGEVVDAELPRDLWDTWDERGSD